MRVWRLASGRYDPLTGEGARLAGGRWNPEGIPAVYATGSLSLAVLETLVHARPDRLPDDLVAFELDVPDDAPFEELVELPEHWNSVNAPVACHDIGRDWVLSKRSLVLVVPSVVVPVERVYILNPLHPRFGKVVVSATRRHPSAG